MYSSKSLLFFVPLITFTSFVYADKSYVDADFSSTASAIQSNSTTGNVTINTTNASTPHIVTNGYGLEVLDGTSLNVNNTNDFTIDGSWGIRVVNTTGSGISQLMLNGSGDLIINSTGQRGIFVGRDGELISDSRVVINAAMAGIWGYDSGSMTFNKEVDITANNYGVIVQKADPSMADPTITFNDKVAINILGSGSAVVAQGVPIPGQGINAQGGKIEFKNGLEATTADGNVIESTDSTQVIVNGDSYLTSSNGTSMVALAADYGQIDINDKAIINGHVAGIDNGVVNLNLTAGSIITGAMTTNSGTGQVNVNMAGGTWNMTESSDITSLALSNTQVKFTDTNFSELTSKTLSGNGNFTLKTDIVAGQGDKLVITNSSSGSHSITVNNQGSSLTNGTEKLTVVETGDGGANFSLANSVELGGFEYGLQRATADSKNWELVGRGQKTSTAEASISFLNSAYLLNYIDTQTLFQRMGDLKAVNGQEGNFWIRGFGGKLNSFNSNQLHGFDMNYNGYQLGIDKLLEISNGNLYLGTMLGYTHGDPDYKRGNGTVKDYNAGLYGTYIDNTGFYVDAVAKYMYMRNRFDVSDTAGRTVKGTAKNQGYSLSIEVGKRFAISNTAFYIEPQSQLTYSYMGDSTTHASNGLKVKLNSYNSTLARAGAAVGYQVNNAQNPIDIYIKTGYVKEFSGKTSYKLNQYKEKYNFRGGWVDSAVGANVQLNNRHNIYGEVSYANGDRFDKQQINLGYRYQF